MSDLSLDPDMAALAAAIVAARPPGPPDAATLRAYIAAHPMPSRSTQVARVEDLTIEGAAGPIAARLYAPAPDAPLIVFYHGGGWVLCTLDTHDSLCQALAAASGAAVLSVDYRLAPEHKFPAAFEDSFAALRWAAAHGRKLGCDVSRLAVAGDSAGGNLAAAVALAAARAGIALRHQLLIYPALDPAQRGASHARYTEAPMLDSPTMAWYWAQYLNGAADYADPRAAPLFAADLAGLAPATVVVAEHDPLFDDGIAYAAALAKAGVAAETLRYDGVLHGFLSMLGLVAKADTAVDAIAQRLRGALAAG